MAELFSVQNDEIQSNLERIKEQSDQARQSHKETMKMLAEFQELLIRRFQFNSTDIGGDESEKLTSNLVGNPNLYYSYEYKPPPASPLVFHIPEPQSQITHQFSSSAIFAPYVFDNSSSRDSVVRSVVPSFSVPNVSSHVNSIVSMSQCSNKICDENSNVLPIFDGNDPRGWIMKARKHFEFKSIMDIDMISLAGLHFEGRARTWYRWFYESKNRKLDWKIFLHDLLLRFDDYEVDLCYLVNPLRIEQQRSVDEYEKEFLQTKDLAEYVYDFVFTEEILAHNFVNGLKEEIRETIDLWSLKTLQGAVNWAKFQELQFEERLLFEASEVEYEISEALRRMFAEIPAPNMDYGNKVTPKNIEVAVEKKCSRVLMNIRASDKALSCKSDVVTMTTHFNNPQMQAAKDATIFSGLGLMQIANELTPTTYAYELANESSRNVGKTNAFTFDPGGKTPDNSLIFVVKVKAGDTYLRSADFNKKMENRSAKEFGRKNDKNDVNNIHNTIQICVAIVAARSREPELLLCVDYGLATHLFHTTRKILNEIRFVFWQLLDKDPVFTLETSIYTLGGKMRLFDLEFCQNMFDAYWRWMNSIEAHHELGYPGLPTAGGPHVGSVTFESVNCFPHTSVHIPPAKFFKWAKFLNDKRSWYVGASWLENASLFDAIWDASKCIYIAKRKIRLIRDTYPILLKKQQEQYLYQNYEKLTRTFALVHTPKPRSVSYGDYHIAMDFLSLVTGRKMMSVKGRILAWFWNVTRLIFDPGNNGCGQICLANLHPWGQGCYEGGAIVTYGADQMGKKPMVLAKENSIYLMLLMQFARPALHWCPNINLMLLLSWFKNTIVLKICMELWLGLKISSLQMACNPSLTVYATHIPGVHDSESMECGAAAGRVRKNTKKANANAAARPLLSLKENMIFTKGFLKFYP